MSGLYTRETQKMTTTRCTPAERRHFEKTAPAGEPALGTLDERLGILCRRLGIRTGTVRASDKERLEYQRWLRQNDPTATDPYAAKP